MISASKRNSVQSSLYQYNTVKSLNCKKFRWDIEFYQIIIHFNLKSKSAWKFGALLPSELNCWHYPKWLQIQTIIGKFSFILCNLRVLRQSIQFLNTGKVHLECSVKRISGQVQFFRFKLPFVLQSFISGVDEYVQIMRMAIQLQQVCNCDSRSCVQNKYLIIVVRKMVLCYGGIQNENIRGAEAIRWDKVKQCRNVPEGGNSALRRQRCAEITFLGLNSIQVRQRRINAKCELWGWWYACTSCNSAFP
ncbi:Hypothetical_protein [Hexamita inflata]|uniref:Hypothetical_protein n=1 Tax=Hexamita inflata TaxID=28002 RepID=A0AA86N693_9EUKA|nr:Hypothetical protein HINF_LOCUS1344 [Hexamita inflata]